MWNEPKLNAPKCEISTPVSAVVKGFNNSQFSNAFKTIKSED